MVTAAAATVVVVAIALLVVNGRPGSVTDPLGAAVAQVSSGRQGLALAQERQKVILQDAATQSFSVTSDPKISTVPPPSSTSGGAPIVSAPPPNPGTAQSIAYSMLPSFGFSTDQFGCLDNIWTRESGWRYNAENASGAYGIPQALPGSRMATAGSDWLTNPATQIRWGLTYIKSRYGTPCNAWAVWQSQGWY
jgi:hypothetical protein